MTLLEAVVSVLVVVTGVAALMGMIINVENANRSMALQHNSLDIFARLSAQIRDAECDVLPLVGRAAANTDPTFLDGALPDFGVNGDWIVQPVNGSSIRLVGDSDGMYGSLNPELATYVPPVRVAFNVIAEPGNPLDAIPAFQINVQIRELMRDPVKDDLMQLDGYWIRVYPIQKLCNQRVDATQRGEY